MAYRYLNPLVRRPKKCRYGIKTFFDPYVVAYGVVLKINFIFQCLNTGGLLVARPKVSTTFQHPWKYIV
jgi:hypothetical protein